MKIPTWYKILSVVVALFFIAPILMFFVGNPDDNIRQLMSGFELNQESMPAVKFALSGGTARNIAISLFIIFATFRDMKTLFYLWMLRFAIEAFDFVINVAINPDWLSLLPVFIILMSLEAFLAYKAMQFAKQSDRATAQT